MEGLKDCYRPIGRQQNQQLLDLYVIENFELKYRLPRSSIYIGIDTLSLTVIKLPIMYSEDPINDITVATKFVGAILNPYCIDAIHGKTYPMHANAEYM